jgi:voltage-gated potassium channel
MNLKAIIENNDTGAGRLFDWIIQSLIVLSLVTFSIETLPDLSQETISRLKGVEMICIVIFSIEYFLRVLVADHKLKFIFSFYGLIDLIAILPFFIAKGIDLRSIRIFRLLRLARALKFLRFSRAANRFANAFASIRQELLLFLLATVFVIYVAAVGIYYFEHTVQPDLFSSVFHSLWWSVTTLTTVGYGDMYPVTVGGRIFSFVVLMVGLSLVAVPAGLIASAMERTIESEENDGKETK